MTHCGKIIIIIVLYVGYLLPFLDKVCRFLLPKMGYKLVFGLVVECPSYMIHNFKH